MEITPRQYGRLEVAAWALRKHAEKNEVCTVLCDSITEVLDEIASEDTLDELRRERFPWPEDSATESGADPASPEGYAVASGQKGGAEGREERLPDVPDWRDGKANDLAFLRRVVADNQGGTLAEILAALKGAGFSGVRIAELIGVDPRRVSEASKGRARKSFLLHFAEVAGIDGGAGKGC